MNAVAIDWEGLEWALTRRSDSADVLHLDLETGEVVSFASLDPALAAGWIYSGVANGRLLAIDPWPPTVEQGWMREFTGRVVDPAARRRLEGALVSSRPAERFKRALTRDPVGRGNWVAFRRRRVRKAARDWLDGSTLWTR